MSEYENDNAAPPGVEAGLGAVTDAWSGQSQPPPDEPEYVDEDTGEGDPEWLDEPVYEQAQPQGWENDPYEAQAVLAEQQARAQDVQRAQEHLAAESGADYAVEQTRVALEAQGLRDVDPEVVAIAANEQLQEIGIGLMNDGYSSDEALQLMREQGIPQAVLEAQAGAAKTWANYHTLERAFLREFRNVP